MSDYNRIPYSRIEEIRRLNRRIEETSDKWEKVMYRKAKKVRIPYERLDGIMKDSTEMIYAINKKKKIKRCMKRILGFMTAFAMILIGWRVLKSI